VPERRAADVSSASTAGSALARIQGWSHTCASRRRVPTSFTSSC
jgi:hypothetical protein